MKRALTVTALLAMGLLVASTLATAQETPPTTGGQVTLGLLGRSDVASSKFFEYREVPKGVSVTSFDLFSGKGASNFELFGQNVARTDQRYFGWANLDWLGIAFDYNQTPHNMGNDAHVIYSETAPGVWSMSQTLRQAIGSAADSTSTSGRTYPFYSNLLGPTFTDANLVNISSLRQRGFVDFDLSKKLPFALNFNYTRDLKSGFRGAESVDILGHISPVVDVPGPLDEVTQNYGVRAEYPLKQGKLGNIHGSFDRNLYVNNVGATFVDNPFRPVDVIYLNNTVTNPGAGPATAMFVNPPDNEASTGRFGAFLKFKYQTRVSADVSIASWTQNAAFYPYGNNSTVLTTAGLPANSTTSLQQPSLNGKIDTTTLNFAFVSRPAKGLGVQARYRTYDLTNKTTRWIITGDMSGSPDRNWSTYAPSVDAPYSHATANPYDTTTKVFSASASYDIKDLTLEGVFRTADLTRTYREATSGRDTGGGFAVVYHANELVDVRANFDRTHRTADGETIYGFQSDEAERTLTRTGINVDLSPGHGLGFTFAYLRRNVDFPNRPDRTIVASGVPVAGAPTFAGTPSGLLLAKYDEFTFEADYAPTAKVELSGYYTWEKDASTNQWSTTTTSTTGGVTTYGLNNLLNYAVTDKGNTFGANLLFHIVPDKWTWSLWVQDQKIDGLNDITAKESRAPGATSNFYDPGRTTLIPAGQGGAADIGDWDDTRLTTFGTQLDYHVAKVWTLGVGYWYEKYTFADAFSLPYSGPASMMPQSILIFMKQNNGDYTANVGFARLTYRF